MSNKNYKYKITPKIKNFLSRKKVIIIVALLVLLAIGAAALTLVNTQTSSNQNNSNNKNNLDDSSLNKIVNDTSSKAQDLIDSGNTGQAIDLYDGLIDSAQDTRLKSSLLKDKSLIYFNEGDYTKAITTIEEITDPDKNSDFESYVAEVYEQAGDKANAIIHYEKAIEYMDSNYTLAKSEVEYYNDRIKVLGE